MRVAFDTNVLAYAAGVRRVDADDPKIDTARHLLIELRGPASLVVPVQALGELFNVVRRWSGNPAHARDVVNVLSTGLFQLPTTADVLFAATDLVARHKLQIWDAVILAAAADFDCSLLLSEDMQHGFVARGLTVVNPFADTAHPKLAALLAR